MTRFQRVHLCFGVCILICISALAARAQTMQDAARHNLGAGVEFCARHMSDVPATVAALSGAGFAYQIQTTNLETRHLFSAPSNTAQVTVIAGQLAPECIVESTHLSPQDAVPLVADMLSRFFPGRFQQIGTPIGCGRFDEINAQIPLSVFVGDGNQNSLCGDTDRVRIGIFSAV